MKAIATVVIAAALLAGCASPQVRELSMWVAATKEQAVSGQIKWSDYYKQLYQRVANLPIGTGGKPKYMEASSGLIDASLAYEAGKIDKEQFESAQRTAQNLIASEEQARATQSAAAWAAAMQNISNSYKQSSQYYQNQNNSLPAYKPPVTCDSRALGGGIQTVCQ